MIELTYRKSNKHKEGKTIQVKSYSNLSLNSAEQIISSIIPWLTIFADKLDFMVLFVCIILQCCFIAIASYNNNNYNLLCSIWGYRYYEVYTEENTYILISGKCIRNKNEIKKFIEGEFYQFNLSSCIRQQNSLTAQFVSFSLSNLANIFYPPQFLQ